MLEERLGTPDHPDPLPPIDNWSRELRERYSGADGGFAGPVGELLAHARSLTAPRPSARWRRRCAELLADAAAREFALAAARAMATCEAAEIWLMAMHVTGLVDQANGDLARGLLWAAALTGEPAAIPDLVAVVVRTGWIDPGFCPDNKIAGGAINALGGLEHSMALEALHRLRAMVTHRGLTKQLDAALLAAAAREGITPAQLVERSVPDHGLAADGTLAWELGAHRVALAIEEAAAVRLSYAGPDGRPRRSPPAALKDGHAAELKEIKAVAKDVRGTLAAERARLEGLLAVERTWPYEEWARRYRDHPITGALARALIWEFEDPDGNWRAALPDEAPPGPGQVRLWHPIRAAADEVGAWRRDITERELRQPFKQAYREIYLLTPAERETETYSNRYAAHIVRYQQLYALFKVRGWRANYLGPYDGGHDGAAVAQLAEGSWRARFFHEPASDPDDHYRITLAATDQVRFERRAGRGWREAPLAEVPQAVFSEAMRDVDLFVGVTSIAADPEWVDRGEDRFTAYWRESAFGTLTAGAEVRADALRRIIPRTKIADRVSFAGRFLVVRGELRTYKIHLGSANILMEPDDSYLCIVTARGTGSAKVFLPFEDERLAVILSKAFLLADDVNITDESIRSQLDRGTRWRP